MEFNIIVITRLNTIRQYEKQKIHFIHFIHFIFIFFSTHL